MRHKTRHAKGNLSLVGVLNIVPMKLLLLLHRMYEHLSLLAYSLTNVSPVQLLTVLSRNFHVVPSAKSFRLAPCYIYPSVWQLVYSLDGGGMASQPVHHQRTRHPLRPRRSHSLLLHCLTWKFRKEGGEGGDREECPRHSSREGLVAEWAEENRT